MRQNDVPSQGSKQEQIAQDVWLVRLSLLLAIVFEVVPIEMDILTSLWLVGAFRDALFVKVGFATAILFPLVIYTARNGASALWCVKWRALAVVVIVANHLYFFVCGKP